MKSKALVFLIGFLFPFFCFSKEVLWLKENFAKAKPGDYLVTTCQKNYTLLLIKEKNSNFILLEEITIPERKVAGKNFSWRKWLDQKAPGFSSWSLYELNLTTGQMERCYSFDKKQWFSLPSTKNFLGTLLVMSFEKVPDEKRKRTGILHDAEIKNGKRLWQPKMTVDGQTIKGIHFDAWTAYWPNDGSDLSGKMIEMYLPKEQRQYASYFPYWLQISGKVGQAKMWVVDSGTDLFSCQPSLQEMGKRFG